MQIRISSPTFCQYYPEHKNHGPIYICAEVVYKFAFQKVPIYKFTIYNHIIIAMWNRTFVSEFLTVLEVSVPSR